jgi:predicted GIY-YIG superfamily endonuclease
MANLPNTATYVGVISQLLIRVNQHKEKLHKDSHTAKYNITKLVYYIGEIHRNDGLKLNFLLRYYLFHRHDFATTDDSSGVHT